MWVDAVEKCPAAILNISIDSNCIDPVAHLLQSRQGPILFIPDSGTSWLPSLFRGHSVLQKPISIEKLKETIDAVIDSERPEADNHVR